MHNKLYIYTHNKNDSTSNIIKKINKKQMNKTTKTIKTEQYKSIGTNFKWFFKKFNINNQFEILS